MLSLFLSPASQRTKESDEESEDEGDSKDSRTSSSSHIRQNGDTRSNKQTLRQAAKTKGNGERCPHQSISMFV